MATTFDTRDRVVSPDGSTPWYMRSQVTLNDDGSISATTRTYTHAWLRGFTGGVLATFSDAQGNIVHKLGPIQYGVDGEHMPFGSPSDRTDTATDTIPAADAQRVDRIDVFIGYMPENRFWDDLATKIPDGVNKLVQFIAWLVQTWTSLNGGGAGSGNGPGPSSSASALVTDPATLVASGVWHGDVRNRLGPMVTVRLPQLATPQPIAPADRVAAGDANGTVTVSWEAVPNATGYWLTVDRGHMVPVHGRTGNLDDHLMMVPFLRMQISGTQKTFTLPFDTTTVRWSVAAVDASGHYAASPSSAPRGFTLAAAVPA